MIVTSAPVLVTGASGFIATRIVEQLLAKGYRVRGTVRSLSKEYVLHTASPYVLDAKDPQKDLVDPAVLVSSTAPHA